MELRLDKRSVRQGLKQMRQVTTGINRATSRAINKTLTFGRRAASQNIAQSLGVTQKSIKNRLKIKKANYGNLYGNVWVGLNPIQVGKLGKARQFKAGAKVGRRRFPGTFTITMPSGYVGVFRRLTKSRDSLEEVTLSMSRFKKFTVKQQMNDRLRVLLAQEINYEVNVKGLIK